MTSQITIPIWFFLLLLVVGGWALLVRLLIPSVRWFLRRRIGERVARTPAVARPVEHEDAMVVGEQIAQRLPHRLQVGTGAVDQNDG